MQSNLNFEGDERVWNREREICTETNEMKKRERETD